MGGAEWVTVSDGDGDGGDDGDAGRFLSGFSITACPLCLLGPRVASTRRNTADRICTQRARPREQGCGALRAGTPARALQPSATRSAPPPAPTPRPPLSAVAPSRSPRRHRLAPAPSPGRPRRDDLGPSIPRRERPDPPPATRRAPGGPAAGHLRLRWAPPPRGPETKATRPLRCRLLLEPRLPGTRRRMGGGGGEIERRGRRGRGPGVGPLRRRPPSCRGPDPSHHPRPASLQGSGFPRPQPENLPRGSRVPPLGGAG